MRTILFRTSVLLLALAISVGLRASITAAQDGAQPSAPDAAQDWPYLFFFSHYEFLGDPNNPEGVRYSDGQPVAKAMDGSSLTMSGRGGWNPYTNTAGGGGQYTIKDASGAVTARGSWRVTEFISFELLPLDDWWGIPGFREEGWQGPPGSASFSGFLTMKATLENEGEGVLRAWCLMPTAAMADKHVGDGISLTGDKFNFTGMEGMEMNMFQSTEGVMFYSTDPLSPGWVLNPAGIAVAKEEGLRRFQAPSSPDSGGYKPPK